MLGTLLEKKLKKLENKKILVVMDDEIAFLGTLDEFDKNTVILKDVSQGSSTEINWSDVSETYEEEIEKKKDVSVGFINWAHVNMGEVYIRVNHISRIWKWHEKRMEEKEAEEDKTTYKRPIYKKDHNIPNIGGSYDMPEGW